MSVIWRPSGVDTLQVGSCFPTPRSAVLPCHRPAARLLSGESRHPRPSPPLRRPLQRSQHVGKVETRLLDPRRGGQGGLPVPEGQLVAEAGRCPLPGTPVKRSEVELRSKRFCHASGFARRVYLVVQGGGRCQNLLRNVRPTCAICRRVWTLRTSASWHVAARG